MTNKITIMDGGMGRQLESMGAPFRQPEWSALALIEAPGYVEKAHDEFIGAGADVIITNSYALVPFHIGQNRFDKEGRKLIRLSAELAQRSVQKSNRDVKIAGSLPPAFGSYRPDLFNAARAESIYRPLIEEQAEYIDYWLPETVSSILEAKTICSFLDNSKPIWLAYSLKDRAGDEGIFPQLRSGDSIEDAVKTARELNVEAILFNCSQVEEMAPALQIMHNLNIDIVYGAYANAFLPINRMNQKANADINILRQDITPKEYYHFAQEWTDYGATIIGGCCGIGPDHIRALTKLND